MPAKKKTSPKDESPFAEMKPDIRKAWVKALRSGKYEQGRSRLCTLEDGKMTYCCLGVLCDVLEKKDKGVARSNKPFNVKSAFNAEKGYAFAYKDQKKKMTTLLSPTLRRELGISKDLQDDLVEMNDNNLCNFKKIASYIESREADDSR